MIESIELNEEVLGDHALQKLEAKRIFKSLGDFLRKNKQAIGMLRSARSFMSSRRDVDSTQQAVDSDFDNMMEDFGEAIAAQSHGALSILSGNLFEMGRDYYIGDHKRTAEEKSKFPPFSSNNAIKGFRFEYSQGQSLIKCLVLGKGGERMYYDGLSQEEKGKFFENHIRSEEAVSGEVLDETYPVRHFAILGQDDMTGGYNVLLLYPNTQELAPIAIAG